MKSGTSVRLLVVACAVLVSVTTDALGQAGDDLDAQEAELVDAQARSHFETGNLAFTAGRYEDALTEFKKAYGMSQRPKLLYNIAVTADRLRRDREALAAFEAYLRALPNAPERDEVRSRIVVLERSLLLASARTVAPSTSTEQQDIVEVEQVLPANDSRPAGTRSSTPWILLGVGAVEVVAGGTLLALALMDKATVQNAPADSRLDEVEAAHRRVPLLSTVGAVATGAGIVTSVVALAWLALRPAEVPITVHAGLHGIGVVGAF